MSDTFYLYSPIIFCLAPWGPYKVSLSSKVTELAGKKPTNPFRSILFESVREQSTESWRQQEQSFYIGSFCQLPDYPRGCSKEQPQQTTSLLDPVLSIVQMWGGGKAGF